MKQHSRLRVPKTRGQRSLVGVRTILSVPLLLIRVHPLSFSVTDNMMRVREREAFFTMHRQPGPLNGAMSNVGGNMSFFMCNEYVTDLSTNGHALSTH